MFESAELGHAISKEIYGKEEPLLRESLLRLQYQMLEKCKFPVIVLVSGLDGAGKGETINQLYAWMDPRYLSTLAFSTPTDEERERPPMWRYWRALPPKGRVGIFSGSWYSDPIHDRIVKTMTKAELDQRLDAINRFEAMLVNEEALVLKFWFHLSKDAQKKRLRSLEKDPHTAWRVDKNSWERTKTYDEFQRVAGHVLRTSNTPWAPWIIVEASDDRYRNLTVGKLMSEAIQKKLERNVDQDYPVAAPLASRIDKVDVLSTLKLQQKMSKDDYEKELSKYQSELWKIVHHPKFIEKGLSAVLVFEGPDAAGKGGAIRRITAALDARNYQIVPVAAPTEEERSHPYLWRFWKHLPRKGRITIFDRSWYGRVLVERVEKFCKENDWLRAYAEINDFEQDQANHNTVVIKFWLQISKEEQLRRFKEREKISFKQFKITDEDWRNREQWDSYHQAVCDMVDRTSTGHAPWTLVEADNKYYSRIKIMKTICKRLQASLDKC